MSRPPSPRDEAHRVRDAVGPRPTGLPPADARRPLVSHASYVPSDVEPPRYGLPSSDYIRRYKQANQVDVERAEKRAELRDAAHAQRPPRSERSARKANTSARTTLCIALGVLGGLAVVALMAMASLAVYECAPRDETFTHERGPPGLDAPCVAITSNDNGQCASPATYSAYANRTGGECCMPTGFVCGVDVQLNKACARGAVRVGDFVGMGPGERMCCHPSGLGASAVGLLKLGKQLVTLQAQAEKLASSGFPAEDLDTLATQLAELTSALSAAGEELPHTLELVSNAKDLAQGAITQRAAEEAAAAERVRQAALAAARERAAAEAAAAALAANESAAEATNTTAP